MHSRSYVHHAVFYLFLLHLVLKDGTRNNAVMSLSDAVIKARVQLFQIVECILLSVPCCEQARLHITVLIFCAIWGVCAGTHQQHHELLSSGPSKM